MDVADARLHELHYGEAGQTEAEKWKNSIWVDSVHLQTFLCSIELMCFSDKYKQFLWYYCILFMWWKNNLGTMFPFFYYFIVSNINSLTVRPNPVQRYLYYTLTILPIILLSHNISSRELQSYAPFLCVAKASSISISFFQI